MSATSAQFDRGLQWYAVLVAAEEQRRLLPLDDRCCRLSHMMVLGGLLSMTPYMRREYPAWLA